MSIVVEKEGKTVSEATLMACEELGLTRNDVDVEILEEGSRGVLGIGVRKARIRVTATSPELTEKGLKSKKALEDILDFFAESYRVELTETSDQIGLNISCGEEKGLVIGRRGENLGAMEYIVGKIANKITENGREKRVYIDVDGYKERREQVINKLARNAARRAKRTGKPVHLESMIAAERKMVYTILRRIPGVRTETKIAEDDLKTIVIIPTTSRRPERRGGENRSAGRSGRGGGYRRRRTNKREVEKPTEKTVVSKEDNGAARVNEGSTEQREDVEGKP